MAISEYTHAPGRAVPNQAAETPAGWNKVLVCAASDAIAGTDIRAKYFALSSFRNASHCRLHSPRALDRVDGRRGFRAAAMQAEKSGARNKYPSSRNGGVQCFRRLVL